VNIFWSHTSQRAECKDFGDVIRFDMTHKTNKHRMPLAMFVGSNHQLQNVVFGQALLRDVSTESFEWLFTSFKECMGGHQPHVILTGEGDHCYWLDVFYVVWFMEKIVLFTIADEDPAMKIAIPKIFAKTHHRYYKFHVLQHWKYELERLYQHHKGLKVELEALFNFLLGPTEFEIAWTATVQNYGLENHPAIKDMWAKKEMWIMAYFKGLYCGRMTSTQRSESTNKVIKYGFMNSVTSLHQFAEKMLEVLQHMDHMDAEECHDSQVLFGWCFLYKLMCCIVSFFVWKCFCVAEKLMLY
jgi:hypothetical protein